MEKLRYPAFSKELKANESKEERTRAKLFAKFEKELSGMESEEFEELTRHADASFRVNELCKGCRVCTRVCPVL